ncbi:phosphoglycerate dehydrogenase [Sutcliffiella rhizosphaerae]|uniref:D-3-phosphoglycerate dehydrogenase n=1 Tax=Sutcliffiella rhizosphaerae TaxID=2880967 RepID=A0ABM8YQW0_9BACI|nr:phosphoglycerate dehydrogenase [Sutcliffiella rhizosphaerae]CAG9622324.1 D-3-phosphoglycerate dehydrogenase [Sutcliffiella rhizosphaerae]
MFHVLVTDAISADGLAPLLEADNIKVYRNNENYNPKDIQALLVRSATQVNEELLSTLPNLQVVARAGVGVDNIDIQAATKHGVVVINAPDGNTISTAEHTFAMISSLVRHIPQANSNVKGLEWNRKKFIGTELFGKTLGIVGFGRIGSEIAKRALAFRMKVVVYDPFLTESRAEKLSVTSLPLEEVMKMADIITVHTPLTKDTKGLLNKSNIHMLKKGVFLVNCARGGIIEEEGLLHFLNNGHVAGAALDVFEIEPPTNRDLVLHERVIVTPHLGASTKEAQYNVSNQVSKDVLAFLNGHSVSTSINLPTIPKEIYNKIQPFFQLGKKVGSILSQAMKTPVEEITVTYAGNITEWETSILTKSIIAGFLRNRVDTTVNEVNAAAIAKERGISYGEKHIDESYGYSNIIEVEAKGKDIRMVVRATFIEGYGARIVHMNGFDIDFSPKGHLLYVQHTDRPGVIGQLGNIFGKHETNIATMHVGRMLQGGKAIMMLSFDQTLDNRLIDEILQIPDISSAITLDL